MSLKIDTASLNQALAASTSRVKKSSGNDFGALLKHAETKRATAAEELEKYVKMTPEERMTQAMLKKLGLTPEDLASMPPEKQAAVMAKIAEMIKQQVQETAQQQAASSPPTL